MNIIQIALKEIKTDFRDIRTFVFMLAFPIVLILVLGTALSNTFTTTIPVEDIQVLYNDQSNNEFSQYFSTFRKEVKKEDITFKKADANTDVKKEVMQGNYDGYVEINEDGVRLFVNETNNIEGSILQGMLTSFVAKYNTASVVAKINPDKIDTVFSNSGHDDYIKETSVNSKKQPGSMDYYAIVMTTMIALYAAMSANNLIDGERNQKTAPRLMASPIRKSELFIGKVFGSIVINFLCIIAIVAFSHFAYKAEWGEHIGFVLLVLLTLVILAISFGLGLSFIMKNGASERIIVMLVIQLASFFGGAYFKYGETEGVLNFIRNLSPLTWVNEALIKVIYTNDLAAALPSIYLNLGLSVLFLVIAIISLQRREGL